MSVDFEPIRLGHHRRRLDPLAVGVVAVTIALGVAVLKPWGDAPTTAGPSAGVIAAQSASLGSPEAVESPSAKASIVLPRVIRASSLSTLTWRQVEPILSWHDAWGIRAIVVQPLADTPVNARQRLIERWYPLASDDEGAPTRVDSNDRAISALGLTFPPTQTPLDVRFWHETSDGLDWVDVQAIDPVPSGGAYLYVRPGVASGLQRPWEAGTYRIDVLVDGAVRRFAMVIPDRFSNVPMPAERPSLRDVGPLVEPGSAVLADLPVGLFATTNGRAVGLAADEGGPLEEAAAWLNLDPGTGRRPRSFVASADLPYATGLGIALPAGAVVTAAAIERLAPEPLAIAPERVDAGAPAPLSGPVVLFEAPSRAWAPGVYRLSLTWTDPEGIHEASWHAELRPGPLRETASLLAAARSWARFAGTTGVILGTTQPLAARDGAEAIGLVPLRPDGAAYPISTGIGCGGTVIAGRPGILGFSYPTDRYASTVNGRILRPFLRRDDQVLMTASLGVPGLILAAPARTSTLPAATYEFRLGGDTTEIYTLCLGMASFDD